MDAWQGWPFARVYMFLVALAFIVVGIQVFLFHWRAAFRSRSMYGPVILAPIIAAAGVTGGFVRTGAVGWVVAAIFAAGFLEGLGGLFLHLKGIASLVGGFTLRNMTSGPPPMLPLAFGALGLTGVLSIIWNTR